MEKTITYHTPNGIILKLDTFKGKKALIADYSISSCYNTKLVLDSLGIEYDTAPNINIVKNLVLQNNYDIIFSNNIFTGSVTGVILLQELKSINGFNTPIVIHTISENDNNYFLNQGFDGYLKKPIKQDETIKLLKKIFRE